MCPARRLPLSNLQIILIALIVVGGRLVIDFSQRIIEGQKKIAEERALEAEIRVLVAEQKALGEAKARYSSPSYIETWAHNDGKMVREGEVLVIPIYEQAGNPAESRADQASPGQAEPLPAWAVWWSLFFDISPPAGLVPGP